jgi:uncharacterized protein (TIGR03083 family)
MSAGTAGLGDVLSALHRSHDRLAAAVSPLSDEQTTGASYCSDWTIAQVMSHLGSGAEIFEMFLDAGLKGEDPPGNDQISPVWDRWNAKRPEEQVRDGLRADVEFLTQVDGLSDAERSRWRLSLFGTEEDLVGVARHRLAEHALHTWDVVVALDPSATVAADAAALVVDGLDVTVGRAGKPLDDPQRVLVVTHDPERRFLLEVDADGARLSPAETAENAEAAELVLPAEAFVRLVYGRLDAAHTPPVDETGADLDALRRAFPGV